MDFFELKRRVYAAPPYFTREQIWHDFLHEMKPGEECLEFGVWNGRSINHMANVRPECKFHGFDSFEGLPEDWIAGCAKGKFKTDAKQLKFSSNVTIHPGWFEESIPKFMRGRDWRMTTRIHIDCDLGSSTDTILKLLASPIRSQKPIFLFDEFYNYRGFEEHEFRAFLDFITKHDLDVEVLGRNVRHQQVMIRII